MQQNPPVQIISHGKTSPALVELWKTLFECERKIQECNSKFKETMRKMFEDEVNQGNFVLLNSNCGTALFVAHKHSAKLHDRSFSTFSSSPDVILAFWDTFGLLWGNSEYIPSRFQVTFEDFCRDYFSNKEPLLSLPHLEKGLEKARNNLVKGLIEHGYYVHVTFHGLKIGNDVEMYITTDPLCAKSTENIDQDNFTFISDIPFIRCFYNKFGFRYKNNNNKKFDGDNYDECVGCNECGDNDECGDCDECDNDDGNANVPNHLTITSQIDSLRHLFSPL